MFKNTENFRTIKAKALADYDVLSRPVWIVPLIEPFDVKMIFMEAENGKTEDGTPVQLWEKTNSNKRRLNWEIHPAGDADDELVVFCYKDAENLKLGDRWITINKAGYAVLTKTRSKAQTFYVTWSTTAGNLLDADKPIRSFIFFPTDKEGNATNERTLGRASDNTGSSTKIKIREGKGYFEAFNASEWILLPVQIVEEVKYRIHDQMITDYYHGGNPELEQNILSEKFRIQRIDQRQWQVLDRTKDSDCMLSIYFQNTKDENPISELFWQFEASRSAQDLFRLSTTINNKKQYIHVTDDRLHLGKTLKGSAEFKVRIPRFVTSSFPYYFEFFLYNANASASVQSASGFRKESPLQSTKIGKIMDPMERIVSLWKAISEKDLKKLEEIMKRQNSAH